MVKKVILEPGRTFHEFSLFPGYTPKDCTLEKINLETILGSLTLRIPILSAAMGSVTSYDLALALGRLGGLGILPARMDTDEAVEIIQRIKTQDLTFVDNPMTASHDDSIDSVIKKIEQRGYSTIPVTDRFGKFYGIFRLTDYWDSDVPSNEPVTKAIIAPDISAINNSSTGMDMSFYQIVINPDMTQKQAKELFKQLPAEKKYLVILNEQNQLIKMAFRQDLEEIPVGIAINTYAGWKGRVEQALHAGANFITVDTSDGHNEFMKELLGKYKAETYSAPICAGNFVTEEGIYDAMQWGASFVKVGMSSGSICITQKEKATGRAPMTALFAAEKAQQLYQRESGIYVPIIMDGGLTCSADMIIALTIADAVMLGGYLNHFYEAAGPKRDKNGKETTVESDIVTVDTWGEGSERARNLQRYGHRERKTFFEEGVDRKIPYKGRMKPYLEKDLAKIKAALSNVGAHNLEEYRQKADIELNSPATTVIVSDAHNVIPK